MNKKETLREIMRAAWNFVRCNGFTISEALKTAWRNAKLQVAMKSRVVEFWYKKATTGELRQAFGTTDQSRYNYEFAGERDSKLTDCVRYWDMVKGGFRMFKAYNLVRIEL